TRTLIADVTAKGNGSASIGNLSGKLIGDVRSDGGRTFTLSGGAVFGNAYGGTHDGLMISSGYFEGNAYGSDTTYNMHGVRMFGGSFRGEAHGGAQGYGLFAGSARSCAVRRAVGNGRRGFDGAGVIYVGETQQNGTEKAAYIGSNAVYRLSSAANVNQIQINASAVPNASIFPNEDSTGGGGDANGLPVGRLISGEAA
ncbi:MAG: hypothetical protein AAFP90_03985, partial [Planctomycetota bacterium]